MHRSFVGWLLPALLAMLVSAVHAMDAPGPVAAADPLDARAAVPPPVYRSTLNRQLRIADDQAIPWREANDTVGRIGGWRAYLREASRAAAADATPAPSADKAPSPTPMPMTPGHRGHRH